MEWQLKGRGAANVVYGYCGDTNSLRGHVLRVRMASAHAPAAIDQLIWAEVLGDANGDDDQRELTYIAQVIAPMLGHKYVFPGVPFTVPASLRTALGGEACADNSGSGGTSDSGGSSGSGGGGPSATLQPDHTTFLANAPPAGYVGIGPAVCMEVKPKWGLRPAAAAAVATSAATGTATAATVAIAAGPATVSAHCTSAAVSITGQAPSNPSPLVASASLGSATGPCVGATPPSPSPLLSAASVAAEQATGGCEAAEYGRRYPRFMLHMLLKHVEDGSPLSLYNPLDLFSGRLDRMQHALACLLRAPSNNLRLFKDGVQVYGAAVKPPAGDRADADGDGGDCGGADGHLPTAAPAYAGLRRLAADLRSFVPDPSGDLPDPEGYTGDFDAPVVAAQPGQDGREDDTASPSSVLASVSSSEGNAFTEEAAGPDSAALQALVRLTALALQVEGVMGRLHAVQALDGVGAQGALQLYHQLQAALKSGELAPPGAAQPIPEAGVTASPASSSEPAAPDHGPSGCKAGAGAGAGNADAAAENMGAGASSTDAAWGARLAALRRYLTSVTAKDCAVMVTLQRAQRVETAAAAASTPREEEGRAAPAPVACAPADCGQQQRGPPDQVQPPPQQQQQQQAPAPWVGVLTDPASGTPYLYKLAFVDLDVKAASKIPRHAELEARLLECACRNARLLAEYAARAGWRA